MHPAQRLLDWPDCQLEMYCGTRVRLFSARHLARTRGNLTFTEALRLFRCQSTW